MDYSELKRIKISKNWAHNELSNTKYLKIWIEQRIKKITCELKKLQI